MLFNRFFRADSKEKEGRIYEGTHLYFRSVTEGHPDKICDQISDAVLDAILGCRTPTARVACETVTTTGMVMVMGEISTTAYADIPSIVRKTVERIGYNDSASGF